MKNAEDPKLNLNVRLLRRIQKAIVKWPESYNQGTFGARFRFNAKKQKEPNCSSACCIAGWACALEGKPPAKVGDISDVARKLLGLTFEQEYKLFQDRAATPKQAVKAIDRLIATGGKKSWPTLRKY